VSIVAFGVAAIGGLLILEVVIRRSDVGAALVLGLLLVLEISSVDLSLNVGPLRVGPTDLLFAVLMTAAVARLLRVERMTVPQRLLIVFGVLVIWSLLRGAGLFGVPPAINEARKFLVFAGAALYFSTIEPRADLLDRIARTWLLVSVLLSALALLRWVADVIGLQADFLRGDGSLRVLPAAAALVIAQGALLSLPLIGDRSRPLLRFLAPPLLVFVVLLQHRTVWVITAAGILYLLFRERAIASHVLAALTVAVVVFAVLISTVFADRDDAVAEQLERSAQSTATFEWRVEGWNALITDGGPSGLLEVSTGQPFGGGWERTMPNGNVVEVSPHSFYVEPYLRVGLVGLAVLLLAYVVALRGTHRAGRWERGQSRPKTATLLSPSVLHTVIAVQLLYYVTYTPNAAQALLLGLGLALAAPLHDREATWSRVEAAA
jgi:hypothetical protein